MDNKFVLKFVRIWWAGFKVCCRWLAFYIVLAIVFLPFAGLDALIGNNAGRILAVPLVLFIILVVPIVFYLASKYLHLLGDDDRDVARGEQSPPPPGAESNAQMGDGIMKKTTVRRMLLAAPAGFLIMAAILTPSPDVFSQVVMAFMMTLVCWTLAFIISRFKSFAQTPESVKRLIVVFVCLLSITMTVCVVSFLDRIHRHREYSSVSYESSESSLGTNPRTAGGER